MDSNSIASLCVALSLEKKATPVVQLSNKQKAKERVRLDKCLREKVLCTRAWNKDTFYVYDYSCLGYDKKCCDREFGRKQVYFLFFS